MSPISEAAVEVAKNTGQALLNRLVDEVEDFIPGIRKKKFDNLLAVSEKISKILNDRHIPLEQCREFAAKGGFVYLPVAAAEDDPTLQDLLAALLVNAVDPNTKENIVHVAFFECVKTMTHEDALILKFCAEKGGSRFNKAEARSRAGLKDDIERFEIALGNLKRLQIITTMKNSVSLEIVEDIEIDDSQHFSLTSFGKAFIEASRP